MNSGEANINVIKKRSSRYYKVLLNNLLNLCYPYDFKLKTLRTFYILSNFLYTLRFYVSTYIHIVICYMVSSNAKLVVRATCPVIPKCRAEKFRLDIG